MFSCLLVISCIVAVYCQCPHGYVEHNGICCKYVKCDPQSYVEVCKVHDGIDKCIPCPKNSYLDDHTDSNFKIPCFLKSCPEDTVEIPNFATKYDSGACHKKCMCDTAKNSCGTDPCSCKIHYCQHGYDLMQNCGCERQQRSVNKIMKSTHPTILTNERREGNDNVTPTQTEVSKTINEIYTETSNKGVILNVEERNLEVNVGNAHENNNKATEVGQLKTDMTSTVLAIGLVTITVAGVGIGIAYHVKKKKQRSRDIINIVNSSNVQIGKKNTYTMINQQE